MKRWLVFSLALAVCSAFCPAAQEGPRIRPAAGAGLWYPADAAKLRAAVEQYLAEVEVEPIPGRYSACIAPHASFAASGRVAAHAFKPLQRGQYDRVIVLAPSNVGTFRGCSMPSAHFFRTPLGDVPVDGESIQKLDVSSFFDVRALVYEPRSYLDPKIARTAIHEQEYAVEVLLPFLQVQLGQFTLLPIIVGELTDHRGATDEHAIRSVAGSIRRIIDERTFVVVSCNFTRYGEIHGFAPFKEDVVSQITNLDLEAFRLILDRDSPGFLEYLRRTRSPLRGATALLCLNDLLDSYTVGRVLAYDTSGRMTGSFERSISYASIAFSDPGLAPPEAREPEPSLLPSREDGRPSQGSQPATPPPPLVPSGGQADKQ